MHPEERDVVLCPIVYRTQDQGARHSCGANLPPGTFTYTTGRFFAYSFFFFLYAHITSVRTRYRRRPLRTRYAYTRYRLFFILSSPGPRVTRIFSSRRTRFSRLSNALDAVCFWESICKHTEHTRLMFPLLQHTTTTASATSCTNDVPCCIIRTTKTPRGRVRNIVNHNMCSTRV